MTRLPLRLAVSLLTFLVGVIITAFWLASRLPYSTEKKLAVSGAKASQQQSASYNKVSFSYDSSLAHEMKAEITPALVLENESDKPDSVTPEHITFRFAGSYASQHEASFFSPEIHIYPIAEYKKALGASKSYVRQFEDDMRALRQMLTQQPGSWKDDIDVSFGMNGSQSFRTHVKHINFKNGRGIMFLTQYDIEPSLINNDGLVYVFQGLTDDGVSYVSATFPVTAPTLNLPKGYDAVSYEDYHLPTYMNDFYGKDGEKKYKWYIGRMTRRLEELSPEKYAPNLLFFEEVIRSLRVQE